MLQAIETCLLGCVEQKEVVSPVAHAERRIPGQQREHDAHFEA